MAFSLPGQFAPRSESANRTLANSLPDPLAPWNLRSRALSLHGLVFMSLFLLHVLGYFAFFV